MRIAFAMLSAAIVATTFRVSFAQVPPAPDAARPEAARPAAAAPVVPVSAQLQPALSAVHQTAELVRIDKWKRGNIRDEAAQNIGQIQRDIDETLPPLLRNADTAPTSLSTLLPVSRNISALYDVLLRVVEASRVVAPDEQVEKLQQALVTLGNARLAFGERMQTAAVVMEKQLTDLHATVQAQADKIAAAPVAAAVPCTPPPHTAPKKATRKPAAKTAGTKSTLPSSSTQAKPGSSTQPNSNSQPAQQNPPQQNTH